jgi:hypothetical protein
VLLGEFPEPAERAAQIIPPLRPHFSRLKPARDLRGGDVGNEAGKDAREFVQVVVKPVVVERLLFIVTALRSLLADENFTTLLRAEDLDTMPDYLGEQIKKNPRHERRTA